MKRILFMTLPLLLLFSCKEECIICNNVEGYPNATICQDTYETTMEELSPTWIEYRDEAINEGCVKQ